MPDPIEIRGGAGEFEAAVIAVVLDRIAEEEEAERRQPPEVSNRPPAWVRSAWPSEPGYPMGTVLPDGYGRH